MPSTKGKPTCPSHGCDVAPTHRGLGVTENGELLVEHSSCRCGATWTKTCPVREEDSE